MRTKADLVRLLEKSRLGFQTIESGRCWMIVCPALAARIMGAGCDEENAFWVPPVLSAQGWKTGGNAGGQRTWIAPEGGPSGFFFTADGSRWEVPVDLDPGHYHSISAPGESASFRTELNSQTSHGVRRRITITRSMRITEEPATPGPCLTVHLRSELGNAGQSALDRTIGLWNLIQLPCEKKGAIFFSLRRDGVSPHPYFGDFSGAAGWLRVKAGTRFKAGLSPDDFTGTLGFVRRSRGEGEQRGSFLLTVMRFDVDPSGTYVDKFSHSPPAAPPNGDAAQAYCDAGTGDLAFCEIEAHAAAPALAPGESQGQDIRITVARVDEKDLADFMKTSLEMDPLPAEALPE